jgi:hypothetical protein
MEIIIVIALLVGIALVWSNYLKKEKSKADSAIDAWQPPKEMVSKEEPWPFGEKLPEGKIHETVADVAPVVEPAPVLTVDGHGDVQEVKPAKKPTAKKTPAKKAADPKPAAKKAPAKKKSAE